jgi:antitoxin FitA
VRIVSKTITVRDVPDELHRKLEARAAREGMRLSDFIKHELAQKVERPTMREWLERTLQSKPISRKHSAAQIIRKLRDGR